MDEDALVRRLDELERMVAGSGPMGGEACRAELAARRKSEPDSEFRLSLPTPTSQLVFLTLCRRYGLQPYRASKQRKSTISVRAPQGFVYDVLQPRVEAMVVEIEEATVAAVGRIMEKWSARVTERDETRASADYAERESGGEREAAEVGVSRGAAESQGRVMIER
jgi:hypothetical protein